MTIPSEVQDATVALRATRERRLHPLSWLFVLLAQLREFALPLIALLFFGRGGNEWWEWFGLGAAVVLPVIAVAQYFTYRFRIENGELVIRSGILHRNVRNIPLSRIQNVALKRNPLHRLFGVAEVRLESAVGGTTAEAQMRVLSMHDAHALEVLVQAGGEHRGASADADASTEEGEELLRLPTAELIKLGLTSNRGLLLGAAGFGIFSQLDDIGLLNRIGRWVKPVFGQARDLHLGWVQWLLIAILLAAILVALLRAVSVLLVLLQYHGFRLSELAQRLSVESGLLTRIRSHAPLRRIQHWTIRENFVHRWFGRRSLKVETAALQVANQSQTMSDVVPIAPPQTIDALLRRWLPWFEPESMHWQALHPRAWRRIFMLPALATTLLLGLVALRFGWPVLLLGAVVLPLMAWRARRIAASASWAITDRVLVWRSGWLDRRMSFAELHKLQGLQLKTSPFDRHHRMASVIADTAGANPFGHRLELHYLPESSARELYARLGTTLAKSSMRW